MLDDDAIARYARQIVVPGIGAAGQEKLLRTTVLVVGHPRAVAQATLYLDAAGVRVTGAGAGEADVAVLAGVASVSPALLAALASSSLPLCWYCVDAHGFTAGVHPSAPLPAAPQECAHEPDAVHDVAACDAAACACAIALGLAHRDGPVRFDL